MKAELRQLDAEYICQMRSPILALAAGVPSAMTLAYQSYVARYPEISAASFRALNADHLSDIGLQITLLDGLFQAEIKVNQISVVAKNLTSNGHITFAQDATVLAHDIVGRIEPDSQIGFAKLEVHAWLATGGLDLVDRLFENSASQPDKLVLEKDESGLEIVYPPHFRIQNPQDRWGVSVKIDWSSKWDADMCISQEFRFFEDGKYQKIEEQIGVFKQTCSYLAKWLDLEL